MVATLNNWIIIIKALVILYSTCYKQLQALSFVTQTYYCLKDTQQGRTISKQAAAATTCVYMKIHNGKLTLTDTRYLDQSTAWNMNCTIQGYIITTYSLKATTTVIHLPRTQRRVRFATWVVVQQSPWFQQEHTVRTAGPWSTLDIWLPHILALCGAASAAATFAGTRHRKSQMAEHHKTKHSSTLSKSTVDHCRAKCTVIEESWPVWFALNDQS